MDRFQSLLNDILNSGYEQAMLEEGKSIKLIQNASTHIVKGFGQIDQTLILDLLKIMLPQEYTKLSPQNPIMGSTLTSADIKVMIIARQRQTITLHLFFPPNGETLCQEFWQRIQAKSVKNPSNKKEPQDNFAETNKSEVTKTNMFQIKQTDPIKIPLDFDPSKDNIDLQTPLTTSNATAQEKIPDKPQFPPPPPLDSDKATMSFALSEKPKKNIEVADEKVSPKPVFTLSEPTNSTSPDQNKWVDSSEEKPSQEAVEADNPFQIIDTNPENFSNEINKSAEESISFNANERSASSQNSEDLPSFFTQEIKTDLLASSQENDTPSGQFQTSIVDPSIRLEFHDQSQLETSDQSMYTQNQSSDHINTQENQNLRSESLNFNLSSMHNTNSVSESSFSIPTGPNTDQSPAIDNDFVPTNKHSQPKGCDLSNFLEFLVEQSGDFIYLFPNEKPRLRTQSSIHILANSPEFTEKISQEIINTILPSYIKKPEQYSDQVCFSIQWQNLGSFFVHLSLTLHGYACSIQNLNHPIKDLHTLDIPQNFIHLLENPRGIIILSSPERQCTETLLMSILEYCNTSLEDFIALWQSKPSHILSSKRSIVQSNIIVDNKLESCLQNLSLHQPKILAIDKNSCPISLDNFPSLIGENNLLIITMKEKDAESCLKTIWQHNDGLKNQYLRNWFSQRLKSILCPRTYLTPSKEPKILTECLISSQNLKNLLFNGELQLISSYMHSQRNIGNISLNDSLIKLMQEEKIDLSEALRITNNKKTLEEYLNRSKIKAPKYR